MRHAMGLLTGVRSRGKRWRIFSVIIVILGVLTVLQCIRVEISNVRAGTVLPLATQSGGPWRVLRTSELAYRESFFRESGDPLWETRPLTSVERAEYTKWAGERNAWNELDGAVSSSCLLIPLVPLVIVCAVLLLRFERSFGWRIALAVVGVAQILVVGTFVHLRLWEALSHEMP
jgi:hypothetical protein